MTAEQIVNTLPCPVIRAKILENVDVAKEYHDIKGVLAGGFHWDKTKEGEDFWAAVAKEPTTGYEQIKSLNNCYLLEPAKPVVVWRKIDKANLPIGLVNCIEVGVGKPDKIMRGELRIGEFGNVVLDLASRRLTDISVSHYLTDSDLLEIPIEQ